MTTAAKGDTVVAHTPATQKKQKYHHGHLRDALIVAAREILERDGIEGLSLRSLAKATGVTQAAPYSHFRDKDELLATIAEEGFQRLAIQMAEDATGAPDTRVRIERLIRSYIRFAQDNRALFGIMFGRELADLSRFPTLAMTAGKSYSLISTALARRTSATVATPLLTVAIWSLCHGLTSLVIDNRINPESFGAASIEDFISKTVETFAGQLV